MEEAGSEQWKHKSCLAITWITSEVILNSEEEKPAWSLICITFFLQVLFSL